MLHFGCSLYMTLHPHKQTEILENWYLRHVLQSLKISKVLEKCPDGTECGNFAFIYMFCCKPITQSVTRAPSEGMKAIGVTGFLAMSIVGIPVATH